MSGLVFPKCERAFSEHDAGACPIEPALPTKERLAIALEEAGAHPQIVQVARDGYFDQCQSPLPMPIATLIQEMNEQGFPDLARRAEQGEFDATEEEIEQWSKLPKSKQTTNDQILGRAERRRQLRESRRKARHTN